MLLLGTPRDGCQVLPGWQEPWDERGLGLLGVLRGVWGRAGLQVLHHRLVFNQIKWISKHSFLWECCSGDEGEEGSSWQEWEVLELSRSQGSLWP